MLIFHVTTGNFPATIKHGLPSFQPCPVSCPPVLPGQPPLEAPILPGSLTSTATWPERPPNLTVARVQAVLPGDRDPQQEEDGPEPGRRLRLGLGRGVQCLETEAAHTAEVVGPGAVLLGPWLAAERGLGWVQRPRCQGSRPVTSGLRSCLSPVAWVGRYPSGRSS